MAKVSSSTWSFKLMEVFHFLSVSSKVTAKHPSRSVLEPGGAPVGRRYGPRTCWCRSLVLTLHCQTSANGHSRRQGGQDGARNTECGRASSPRHRASVWMAFGTFAAIQEHSTQRLPLLLTLLVIRIQCAGCVVHRWMRTPCPGARRPPR